MSGSSTPFVSATSTPPTMSRASSTSGQSEPASSAMTPSRSWQRLSPQSTFVNGRGNVQQAGAATQYVPHSGAPVLGPPVQQQGQQAYVRREPSPSASVSRGGSEVSTLQPDAAGESAAVLLPTQFGSVRQRVAIKTSSRPPAPRSSLTPQRRSSAMSATLSAEGRALANRASTHSPHAGSSSPTLYPVSTPSSRSTSLQPPSPHVSTPTYTSTAPTSARSPSPSPSARSGYSSVLDRPRPRTPDPTTSLSLVPSSPSPTVNRSSFASGNGAGSGTVTPTPSAPSSAQKVNVLDRPRPKTPDASEPFRFGDGDGSESARLSRSRTPNLKPRTPAGGNVFAFSAPGQDDTDDTEEDEQESHRVQDTEPSVTYNVLDRPRPRTPDSQAWLDGAYAARKYGAPQAAGNDLALHGRFGAQHHRPSGSGTTTSGFSSYKGGSFDSLGPTALSVSTQGSTTATSARPSIDSNYPSSGRNAPLLNFNFDFGSSFGSTETMFGLSDLLKFGTNSGEPLTTSSTSLPDKPLKSPLAAAPASASPAAILPGKVPQTGDLPANMSPGPSAYLNLPGGSPDAANGRVTPRKEPPKVDLQLELELEMERALPPHRPLVTDVPRTSVSSTAGTEGEPGRPAPGGHVSVSSIGSTAASGRSVSGASVFSTSLNGTGSSPRPKRRRRKSLASMLSFGSFSQTGHGRETGASKGEVEDDETELPRKVPLAPPILPPVATAQPIDLSASGEGAPSADTGPSSIAAVAFAPFDPTTAGLFPPFGELSLDKSLPPTPAADPSSSPSVTGSPRIPQVVSEAAPDSPSKRSLQAAVGAANKGLTRQLSKLRHRRASASSSTAPEARSRNPNFQLISATTTRRPSEQYDHDSRTALQLTEAHASPKSSLDLENHPSFDMRTARSARPRTETASSAPSATSVPFGRRLVDRFTGGSTSKSPPVAGPPKDSWTAPVRDHSDEIAPARRLGRRRGSFSSLLGVKSSSARANADGASSVGGAKKILGMSLPAGRKSDDLLTSRRVADGESGEHQSFPNGHLTAQKASDRGSRRSFDLLTDRAAIRRRPSTDDLLTLASAKLSALGESRESADTSTASPSAQLLTVETAQLSTNSSGISTPTEDEAADKQSTVITKASVVSLSEAEASPVTRIAHTSTAASPRLAEPRLVRSDSLPTGDLSTLETAPQMPVHSVPPTQTAMNQLARDPALSNRPPAPRPTFSSKAEHVKPIWRSAEAGRVPTSSQEKRMTRSWLELEDALEAYSSLVHDRAAIVNSVLLPFLRREEENQSPRAAESLTHRHRALLFRWLHVLLTELTEVQASHRGTCLDGVIAIAESHFLATEALRDDLEAQQRYRSLLLRMLDFAIDKLNHKAVYANVLAFSSRVFALAFFRIEGVAIKLLRALPPVKRQGTKRILDEAGIDENHLPPVDANAFPAHLSSLLLRDYRAHTTLLLAPRPPTLDVEVLVQEEDIKIELTGNWLIRWTASDSDLSFAFYRNYHRQLAAHILPFSLRAKTANLELLPPAVIITAPGYLFLAASLLEKIDSLVHRSLRAVTSIGPQSGNFNTNDSANLSFGQKPKVLELAQRRVVQTLVDIVGGPPSALINESGALDAASRRYIFGSMLQVWIRACVKRTSLWDVRGVFLVSDLIEGLMYSLAYSTRSPVGGDDDEPPTPDERGLRLFDLPFLFHTVRIILEQADNTVTIMRTIALLYSNFDAFTLDRQNRTDLCEKLILDEQLFQRLLLHYNSGVRGYWIRLLVWRVSRLGKAAQEKYPDKPPDEDVVALFSLLNARLEAIRRRHDQLEPVNNLVDDPSFFRPKRSTICSTRGVKEAPWALDALGGTLEEESDDDEDSVQELVRPVPSDAQAANGARKHDLKTVAKVVSWLKGGLGKKQGKGTRTSLGDPGVDPFLLEQEDSARPSDSTDVQLGPTPLPTTVETGFVPTRDSSGPHTAAAPKQNVDDPLSPTSNARRPQPKSARAERRRSLNPAFFAFEFENGVVTRTDVDPTVASSGASAASVSTTGTGDTTFPSSPIRPRAATGSAALSPRVSLRFSKRISILPPAALDLLKEAHGSEPVPDIPARFRDNVAAGYDKKLHPYAVRGLRDYEDALDEWTDWVAQLEEEEGERRATVDVVPRLAVSWPLSGSDD